MPPRTIQVVDVVSDISSEVGEGPVWDERSEVLRWVDVFNGVVHGHDPHGGDLPSFDLGHPVGFLVPFGDHDFLAGVRDGFAVMDAHGGLEMKLEIGSDGSGSKMRMNDGKADPFGRVWAGRMNSVDPIGPEGALFRLDSQWNLTLHLDRLRMPNGIGWSPAGTTMYFTDTTWGRIDAFDYDPITGEATRRRQFVEIPPEAGAPDGLTVDEEGCVWVALWGGGAVHRYTPKGRLDSVIRIPALHATSCTFGGADRRDLYITSARFRLTPEEAQLFPNSGKVFRARPGVAGMRTNAFASASNSESR